MGLRIRTTGTAEKNLSDAQNDAQESLEKLTSGNRFTRSHPLPSEQARAELLQSHIRENNSYRRNAQDSLSLMEFADSNLSQMSNINIRMREIVNQAVHPDLSKVDRQSMFAEYQGLYEEIDRIANSANYNGITLLNYQSGNPQTLDIQVGRARDGKSEEKNKIQVEDLDSVRANPRDMGLVHAREILLNEDGVSVDDVLNNFEADDVTEINQSFDKVDSQIAQYRSKFGAAATRLHYTVQSLDTVEENLNATLSRLKDVDYATELTNLTRANILMKAGSMLIAQQHDVERQTILNLVKNVEH